MDRVALPVQRALRGRAGHQVCQDPKATQDPKVLWVVQVTLDHLERPVDLDLQVSVEMQDNRDRQVLQDSRVQRELWDLQVIISFSNRTTDTKF